MKYARLRLSWLLTEAREISVIQSRQSIVVVVLHIVYTTPKSCYGTERLVDTLVPNLRNARLAASQCGYS